MLIHGQNDRRFPVKFALKLKRSFQSSKVDLYLAPGAGHSDSSKTPGYGPAVKKFLDQKEFVGIEECFDDFTDQIHAVELRCLHRDRDCRLGPDASRV